MKQRPSKLTAFWALLVLGLPFALIRDVALYLTLCFWLGAPAMFIAMPVQAQQLPQYDLTRHPDGYVVVTRRPSPLGRSYTLTYAALVASTVADVETTFRGLDRCSSCREANPLLRPFVERGRGATYGVSIGLNILTMELARRSKRRGNRGWWVGPALQGSFHAGAAIWNSQQKDD